MNISEDIVTEIHGKLSLINVQTSDMSIKLSVIQLLSTLFHVSTKQLDKLFVNHQLGIVAGFPDSCFPDYQKVISGWGHKIQRLPIGGGP